MATFVIPPERKGSPEGGNGKQGGEIIEKIGKKYKQVPRNNKTRALIPKGKRSVRNQTGEIKKYTKKSLILAQDER